MRSRELPGTTFAVRFPENNLHDSERSSANQIQAFGIINDLILI